VEITEDTVIDTTGTKKVRLEVDQAYIDDPTTIPTDRSGVATIETGASYPGSGNFVKLASITSGSITDEREYITGSKFVDLTEAQSIGGNKTFTGNTIFDVLPQKSGSGASLEASSDGDMVTKYHLDNNPSPVPSADTVTEGISYRATDAEAEAMSETTNHVTPAHLDYAKLKFDVVQFSRDIRGASGSVTYNHSLGRQPRAILFFMV